MMFNTSSAAFACKGPQTSSGANKTLSSLLTAITKISSEDCCSRDHQLTYARSANPKIVRRVPDLLLGGVWAQDYTQIIADNGCGSVAARRVSGAGKRMRAVDGKQEINLVWVEMKLHSLLC